MDWAVNFLGILVAIAIAVWLGPLVASRNAKRDQKERLLRDLLQTWKTVANPVYQSAINHIPLDFADSPKVLTERKAYLELCSIPLPDEEEERHVWVRNQVEGQTKLIEAMAKELDYALTANELTTTTYLAQAFVDRDVALMSALEAWPRIAAALEAQTYFMLKTADDQK